MERQEFLTLLDELFELPVGTLKGAEQLDDLGHWDSLTMMGFVALANEHFDKTLSPRQFANCSKINDLLHLVDLHV